MYSYSSSNIEILILDILQKLIFVSQYPAKKGISYSVKKENQELKIH